jgi:hypothetical protein
LGWDFIFSVTLKSSGISRPQQLDGKVYASYAARFEGRIVQKLIQADGGKGDYKESTPEKLGIWNTLVTGEADATWVFKGWEGVEAALKGLELNEFTLGDYGSVFQGFLSFESFILHFLCERITIIPTSSQDVLV